MARRVTQADRAAMGRDLIWALLLRLHNPGLPDGGWVTSSRVWKAWMDGRPMTGIAYVDDWIGNRDFFTRTLNRLVKEGRAEKCKLPGRHPTYRVVLPEL